LFDVMRGSHASVLCFGPNARERARQLQALSGAKSRCFAVVNEQTAQGPLCLLDPRGLLQRTYGACNESAIVIRPDGYLGLLTDSASPVQAVTAYLRSIGQAA
jgi:hypothetical protein